MPTRLLAIIASLLFCLLPVLDAGAQSTAQPGVSGSTYVSPTYGFTLQWDATWTVDSATSSGGSDALQLDNGLSTVVIEGVATNDDQAACVRHAAAAAKSTPGFSSFASVKDANGDRLQGEDAAGSWGLYHTTFTASDGTASKLALYYVCRQLTPGQAMVRVSQYVATAQYEQQAPLRDTLLSTLVTSSASSTVFATIDSGASILSGLGTPSASSTTSVTADTGVIDLPAMSIHPEDIAQPGFGLQYSAAWSVGDLARWLTADLSEQDSYRSAFKTRNFAAGWNGIMGLPPESGNFGELANTEVHSVLLAFDTPDDAASAYVMVKDGLADPREQPEAIQPEIGDASYAFSVVVEDPSGVGPTEQFEEILFRTGRIVADIRVLTYLPTAAPTYEAAEPIAVKALDRIQQGLQQGGTTLNLSQTALRLDEPADTANPDTDAYVRVNGTDQPLYNTSAADLITYNQRFGRATDVYMVSQTVSSQLIPVDYYIRQYQFADIADAEAWLEGDYQNSLTVSNLQWSAGTVEVGDESAVITFEFTHDDGTVGYDVVLIARVGTMGITIGLESTSPPDVATAAQLAQEQVACLSATTPCERVTFPAASS